MAARGPRPNPRSARSADGRNTLRKPIRKSSSTPAMPARLAARPDAASFWAAHADELTAAGRLRPELAEAFGIACELHADCIELAAKVAAEGWIADGNASPYARLLRDARRDFVALAREFGLTAASDTRLPQEATDGKEEADPEAALLQRLKVRRA